MSFSLVQVQLREYELRGVWTHWLRRNRSLKNEYPKMSLRNENINSENLHPENSPSSQFCTAVQLRIGKTRWLLLQFCMINFSDQVMPNIVFQVQILERQNLHFADFFLFRQLAVIFFSQKMYQLFDILIIKDTP